MRKSNLILVLMGCFILLSAASCNPNGNGGDIAEENYRTGNQGLDISFMHNAPPDNIYSGNDMEIIIEVRNAGAYPETDSFDGKLEIYGFDERSFSGERWDGGNTISPRLQGRSQFSPQGGRDTRRYHVERVETLFNSEFYEPTIKVAACYKYRTIAEPLICIDPEPYSVFDEEKVCTISQSGETYSLGTQGAPVAVTKVTEEISSKNIHFGIHIKNVGNGDVLDENVRKDCPLNLDYNDVDKVMVTAKLPYDGAPLISL